MTAACTYSGRDYQSGEGRTLHVLDGRIEAVRPCDAADLPILAPGLVDMQVNGFRGHDLNDGALEASEVEALSYALASVGVATYLPTLITADEDSLCQRLGAIAEARRSLPFSQRMIAGVHVEGPAISAADGPRGAHPLEHVRNPSMAEFERWQEAAQGLVRIVTLAPERDGAIAFIRGLSERGVIVALGHSDGSVDDIAAAAAAGARMSTHLGNGIAATLPRHPNTIWEQLADDRFVASLILDGHHLPRATARAMIRAKGVENLVLVSDSVKFAGMPAGRYSSPIGGEVEVGADGKVSIAGTEFLAGSGSSLLDIVCRYQAFTGFLQAEALVMATGNPARLLGLDCTLEEGAPANFILLENDSVGGRACPVDIVMNGVSVL